MAAQLGTEALLPWIYKHVVIRAQVKGKDISDYPVGAVNRALNRLASEGWELVSMEPHWQWERKGISLAMEVAYPLAITHWYCTFRKQVGAAEVPIAEETAEAIAGQLAPASRFQPEEHAQIPEETFTRYAREFEKLGMREEEQKALVHEIIAEELLFVVSSSDFNIFVSGDTVKDAWIAGTDRSLTVFQERQGDEPMFLGEARQTWTEVAKQIPYQEIAKVEQLEIPGLGGINSLKVFTKDSQIQLIPTIHTFSRSKVVNQLLQFFSEMTAYFREMAEGTIT